MSVQNNDLFLVLKITHQTRDCKTRMSYRYCIVAGQTPTSSPATQQNPWNDLNKTAARSDSTSKLYGAVIYQPH